MTIVEHLIQKYNLQADSYYTESPYKAWGQNAVSCPIDNLETKMSKYFEPRVVEGYYGISIGNPVPISWLNVINDFLHYLETSSPDFKIYQIKIKYGGIRMYLTDLKEEDEKLVDELSRLLYDKHLIY